MAGMIAFINTQGKERVEQITRQANDDFTSMSQKKLLEKSTELKDQMVKDVASAEVKAKIAQSKKMNEARINRMRETNALVESLLGEARLRITTTDLRGIASESTAALTLRTGEEARHSFRLPEDCASVGFQLEAELERSGRPPLRFQAARSYDLNGIDRTREVRSSYLIESAEGYQLEVRGKNGEPCPHVIVGCRLAPRTTAPRSSRSIASAPSVTPW